MDRRTILSAGLATLGAVGAAGPGRAEPIILSQGSKGAVDYAAPLAAIYAYMEQHRRDYGLPGLVLSVADGDGFAAVLSCGYSEPESRTPVDPGQLFQIGSISKSIAAIAAFRLHAAGRLDLDAPVARVLPDVPLPAEPTITFRHLLHHTAGLPDDAPLFPRSPDGRLWIGNPPGTAWSYSNLGYRMLGLAMARTESKTLEAVLREQVMAPLGMTNSVAAIVGADRARYAGGYSPYFIDRPFPRGGRLAPAQWVDMVEAAGCVAATAGDMSRYLAWLIAAGAGRGGALLSDADAKRFIEDSTPAPGWAPGARYANGLAIVKIKGRTLLHHTGGMTNFSSALHVDPAAGVGAFASTNMGGAGYRPRDITAQACALLAAARGGSAAGDAPATRPKIAKPSDYAGRYFAGGGRLLELAERDGGLVLIADGASGELEPAGDDQLLSRLPAFDRYVFAAERTDRQVRALWWGAIRFTRGAPAETAPIPPALAARSGRYVNDSPWLGLIEITARPDGLYLFGTRKLAALPDGSWRPQEDSPSPERIWFDAPIGGRMQRLSYSGVDFLREDS